MIKIAACVLSATENSGMKMNMAKQKNPRLLFFMAIIILSFALTYACATPNDISPFGAKAEDANEDNIYPHEVGWQSYTLHGKYISDNSLEKCAKCHGEQFDGGWTKKSCYSCHKNYPHIDKNWNTIDGHGIFVFNNGGPSICATKCHGDDLRGGVSNNSCYLCHPVYPHPEYWISNHDSTIEDKGIGTCMTRCHGEDFKGGKNNVSCFSCHTNGFDDIKNSQKN